MIRRGTTADAPAIAEIYNHFVLETTVTFEIEPLTLPEMEQRLQHISTHFPFYVSEQDGAVNGFCYVHEWKSRPAYARTLEVTIYLVPEAQGCGTGHQLLSLVVDECRRAGYHALIACITAENVVSIAFHKKMGFKQVSHFEKVGYKFGRILDVDDLELLLI